MSQPKRSKCRFVLHDINDNLIRDENGYDIFDPTVILELDGRNVFQAFGISGVEHPVIMHSLEKFLQVTLSLVRQLDSQPNSEYRYWFLGTGFGFKLERHGTDMALFLVVDGHWGPVQGLSYPQSKKVGMVTVLDWVQSMVAFATDLIYLFKRFNPRTYSFLKELEFENKELRDWVSSSE